MKTLALALLLLGQEKGLPQAEVDRLLPVIRLSPGEDPFSDIPWFVDVAAAQRKAAAEGKPLFVFANGGEPVGGT